MSSVLEIRQLSTKSQLPEHVHILCLLQIVLCSSPFFLQRIRTTGTKMRRSVLALWQSGVHVPKGKGFNAARMANWPEAKIPDNFHFQEEQRFRLKAVPRDTGKIPRDFLLTVLYRHQPCEIDKLWDFCSADPRCVLDSKRHLRAVLKQAREEGFLSLEKIASSADNTAVVDWHCVLSRERYGEVKQMVAKVADASTIASASGLRGGNITETTESLNAFRELNEEAKKEHKTMLEKQVAETTEMLRKFQRTEIDYLPYTDLNGKVQFMWWYEARDRSNRAAESLPEGNSGDLVPAEESAAAATTTSNV